MKTICNINVYGLDPATWDAFRAALRARELSISSWTIAAINAYLTQIGSTYTPNSK